MSKSFCEIILADDFISANNINNVLIKTKPHQLCLSPDSHCAATFLPWWRYAYNEGCLVSSLSTWQMSADNSCPPSVFGFCMPPLVKGIQMNLLNGRSAIVLQVSQGMQLAAVCFHRNTVCSHTL